MLLRSLVHFRILPYFVLLIWSFFMQILKRMASTQKWTKYSDFWAKSLIIYNSKICQIVKMIPATWGKMNHPNMYAQWGPSTGSSLLWDSPAAVLLRRSSQATVGEDISQIGLISLVLLWSPVINHDIPQPWSTIISRDQPWCPVISCDLLWKTMISRDQRNQLWFPVIYHEKQINIQIFICAGPVNQYRTAQ